MNGGPLYGLSPENGLDVLAHSWKQQTYFEAQCQALLKDGALLRAVEVTRGRCQQGKIPNYVLSRSCRDGLNKSAGRWEENHWEEALWRKYSRETSIPLEGIWSKIISYEVQAPIVRGKGWCCIDLMAVSTEGLPVVVELKPHNCHQSPLGMVLQGCTYAMALRQDWRSFRAQFQRAAALLNVGLPDELETLPVVCLAPCEYWCECVNQNVLRPGWCSFQRLKHCLAESGFPTTFAAVHHEGKDEFHLPRIVGVLPVKLPT
jgi:hypothetical protein